MDKQPMLFSPLYFPFLFLFNNNQFYCVFLVTIYGIAAVWD